MDRRLIDLERKEFKDEIERRGMCLDIPMMNMLGLIDSAWDQLYSVAFDTEYRGPEISQSQCEARIGDLEAYIEQRRSVGSTGQADFYANVLAAMKATYTEATGDQAGPQEVPSRPSLAELQAMHFKTQQKMVTDLTGTRPGNKEEVAAVYSDWLAAQESVNA